MLGGAEFNFVSAQPPRRGGKHILHVRVWLGSETGVIRSPGLRVVRLIGNVITTPVDGNRQLEQIY